MRVGGGAGGAPARGQRQARERRKGRERGGTDTHSAQDRHARIRGVATREQVHKLVDELPESRLDPVAEFISEQSGAEDKPGDIIDDWGNLSAMKRRSSARLMKRLSEEEITANGETLADAWGYDQKHPR